MDLGLHVDMGVTVCGLPQGMVTDASPQTAPQSSQDGAGQQALAVDGGGEHAAYVYQQTK